MKRVQKCALAMKRKPRVLSVTKGTHALLSGFDKLKPAQRGKLLDELLKQCGPRWRQLLGDYVTAARVS